MRRFWWKIKAAWWYARTVPWVLVQAMWFAAVARNDDCGDRAGKADSVGCDTDDLVLDRSGKWIRTNRKKG